MRSPALLAALFLSVTGCSTANDAPSHAGSPDAGEESDDAPAGPDGDAGPTALASYASWLAGAALAVDGTDVYWSTEDGSGSYGEIVRCSIGGCSGSPTPLAGTSSKSPSAGLAVDATNVYWSDPGRGAVMMAPK